MNTPLPLPALCTPDQASQALGVPLSRLARWRSDGVGPRYIRMNGGRISYRVDAIIDFINEKTVLPTGDIGRR